MIRRHGSLSEADLGLDPLMALPVRVAVEFSNWSNRHGAAPVDAPPPSPPTASDTGLPEPEMRYLRAVLGDPGKPSSIYPKAAQMSPRRASAIRDQLIAAGYLRPHTLATGARGREALVLEPLEKARMAVRDATSPPQGGAQ